MTEVSPPNRARGAAGGDVALPLTTARSRCAVRGGLAITLEPALSLLEPNPIRVA